MNKLIILLLMLSGCGPEYIYRYVPVPSPSPVYGLPGPQGSPGPAGSPGPQGLQGATGPQGIPTTPNPTPSPDVVQMIVDNYNEYLVRCTLYNVINMPAIPCLLSSSITGCTQLSTTIGYTNVGSWTYVGSFNQVSVPSSEGFNVLPTALQKIYENNFAVTCTGYFVNPDYNYHEFDVDSDDGSLLYINGGNPIVNNDGQHAITDVASEKYLQAQVYSFQLNYFQDQGNVGLIVNEDGNLLLASQLYH